MLHLTTGSSQSACAHPASSRRSGTAHAVLVNQVPAHSTQYSITTLAGVKAATPLVIAAALYICMLTRLP